MTPQEQADCERVTAWFEPKPDKPWTGQALATIMGRRSDKGFWTWNYDSWIPSYCFSGFESHNAILREAMPHVKIQRIGSYWKVWYDGEYQPMSPVEDHDYKRAIVGAFLKFLEVNK